MMKKIMCILVLFATVQIQAQESIPISLQNVLELGGANDLTILQYQERRSLASADLSKAREWWLPNIDLGVQTHQLWGAAMNGNGRFFLDTERNNLGLGLGANANWNLAEGIYKVRSSKLNEDISELHSQAERNKTLLKSIHAYYNLLKAQHTMLAYNELLDLSDTIINQIQLQVDAGIRYQSEALLAKSNRGHLKVGSLNAQKEYELASARLLYQLDLDQNVKLVISDPVLLP